MTRKSNTTGGSVLVVVIVFAFVVGLLLFASPAKSDVITSSTWTCNGPVEEAFVEVVNPADTGVELDTGCTGHIGHLVVTGAQRDGVKVKNGSLNAAHDLVIDHLTVQCEPAPAGIHQDGVQVLGGARIAFNDVHVTGCRTSQVMLKQGGSKRTVPTDITFSNGFFGGGSAHTFIIGTSLRSGVSDSTLCIDTTPRNGAVEFPGGAVEPVNTDNMVAAC